MPPIVVPRCLSFQVGTGSSGPRGRIAGPKMLPFGALAAGLVSGVLGCVADPGAWFSQAGIEVVVTFFVGAVFFEIRWRAVISRM